LKLLKNDIKMCIAKVQLIPDHKQSIEMIPRIGNNKSAINLYHITCITNAIYWIRCTNSKQSRKKQ